MLLLQRLEVSGAAALLEVDPPRHGDGGRYVIQKEEDRLVVEARVRRRVEVLVSTELGHERLDLLLGRLLGRRRRRRRSVELRLAVDRLRRKQRDLARERHLQQLRLLSGLLAQEDKERLDQCTRGCGCGRHEVLAAVREACLRDSQIAELFGDDLALVGRRVAPGEEELQQLVRRSRPLDALQLGQPFAVGLELNLADGKLLAGQLAACRRSLNIHNALRR
jgi:hypothetical protein